MNDNYFLQWIKSDNKNGMDNNSNFKQSHNDFNQAKHILLLKDYHDHVLPQKIQIKYFKSMDIELNYYKNRKYIEKMNKVIDKLNNKNSLCFAGVFGVWRFELPKWMNATTLN